MKRMENALEIIQAFRKEHDNFFQKRSAYKEKIREQFAQKEYGRIEELSYQLLMLDCDGNPVSSVIYEFRSKQKSSPKHTKRISLNTEFERLKEEALLLHQEEQRLQQKDKDLVHTLLHPLLEKDDEESIHELKSLYSQYPTTTAKYHFYKMTEQKIKTEEIYRHLQNKPQNS